MKKSFLVSTLFLTLFLGACWQRQEEDPLTNIPDDDLPPAEEVTHNVRYRGVLEEAGISIYMEGTHRLVLDDGSIIYLESDDVDLDSYLEQDVEVAGDVRPTVEASGRIMNVLSLVVLSEESSSSAASSEAMSSSVASSLAASSSMRSSMASSIRSDMYSSPRSSSVASSSVAPDVDTSGQMGSRTAAMANASMDPSAWTQSYCSTHIKFCFPVHKNWWYKSFGATTSSLWHVEVSSEEIFNLEDGPLVVTLQSGAHASADPTIEVRDGFVFAKAAWDATSHFEVRAPAVLRSAVEYIIRNIRALPESSSSSAS